MKGSTVPEAGVGRNDPCPCGSGLKFKKCCQGREAPTPRPPPLGGARTARELHKVATGHWAAGRLAEAIAAFREVAQLQPESAEAHHNLGAALFGVGDLAQAAVSLERAVSLRPAYGDALRKLAVALEHLARDTDAAAAYRRLARVAKDPIGRRLALARALHLEGASGDSEAELRRAIAVAPAHAPTRVLLGQLLMERGEFEEAERHLVDAIEDFPDAFQAVAVSRRMTEADRPLVDRVSAMVDSRALGVVQRSAVLFGLGKAHDDLWDCAAAIRRYDAGNALRGISARLDRPGLVAHYDAVVATYTAAALDAARPSGPRAPDPDDDLPVLIVGMPRSGTTLLEQILSSHPDVAAGGELSFWSDRVREWLAPAPDATGVRAAGRLPRAGRPADEVLLSQAAGDYLARLRRVGAGAPRVIDKAPSNVDRLGQIRSALPAARIIHCRRGPADTCLSMFFTNHNGRRSWTRADLVFQYRQYQRLMDHWRAVLSPDRFIEVDYEAVITDREAQTRRLIDFCGLAWNAACLTPENNPRPVKSASLWQARQPAYASSIDRWRRYEPWLGEFRELLPD